MLNGQCPGICGGASYREERLTLAERGKMDVLKINDDDDESFATSGNEFYDGWCCGILIFRACC